MVRALSHVFFFNPGPVRRVPIPNRYTAKAKLCFCKNNKRRIIIDLNHNTHDTTPTMAPANMCVLATQQNCYWLELPEDMSASGRRSAVKPSLPACCRSPDFASSCKTLWHAKSCTIALVLICRRRGCHLCLAKASRSYTSSPDDRRTSCSHHSSGNYV